MEFKNNKGISLVALIITIIIMLIIAGIVLYNGSGEIKQAKTESIRTNMLLVQAQIKNYVEQAKFEKKDAEGNTNSIDGVTVDDVTIKIKASSQANYYEIDTSEDSGLMSKLGLGGLNPEDYLISFNISEITVDVYYVPGVTDAEGNTYNKLSDMH